MQSGNAPEVDEVYFLQDDEEKVVMEIFHKAENAVTYTFNKEDHTLGNLLRIQLLKDAEVKFSGYKMPHPVSGGPL